MRFAKSSDLVLRTLMHAHAARGLCLGLERSPPEAHAGSGMAICRLSAFCIFFTFNDL